MKKLIIVIAFIGVGMSFAQDSVRINNIGDIGDDGIYIIQDTTFSLSNYTLIGEVNNGKMVGNWSRSYELNGEKCKGVSVYDNGKLVKEYSYIKDSLLCTASYDIERRMLKHFIYDKELHLIEERRILQFDLVSSYDNIISLMVGEGYCNQSVIIKFSENKVKGKYYLIKRVFICDELISEDRIRIDKSEVRYIGGHLSEAKID